MSLEIESVSYVSHDSILEDPEVNEEFMSNLCDVGPWTWGDTEVVLVYADKFAEEMERFCGEVEEDDEPFPASCQKLAEIRKKIEEVKELKGKGILYVKISG